MLQYSYRIPESPPGTIELVLLEEGQRNPGPPLSGAVDKLVTMQVLERNLMHSILILQLGPCMPGPSPTGVSAMQAL